jgi:hypothetical protein
LRIRPRRHERLELGKLDAAVVIRVVLLALVLQRLGCSIESEFSVFEDSVLIHVQPLEVLFDHAIAIDESSATTAGESRRLGSSRTLATRRHPELHSA